LEYLEQYPLIRILLTTLTSLVIAVVSIPSIIKVADLKNLYDEPCSRKKHNKSVPTLGGIAIFAGAIFSTTFWANQQQIIELQYIIASLIILFFIGIKDDIVNLVAHKKLIGQCIAASVLVFWGDIRLTSLYGIFDIYNIPYAPSCLLSIISIIALTNAFNLIDGIDTLAGSVGVLSALTFGTWFYLSQNYQYAIVSFSLFGALLGFLYFNKTPAKIFMGDTGSLVLGLICSILAIKFIELNRSYYGPKVYSMKSAPTIAISILIIPVFDLCRVFLVRILQGRSPLSPDRNHLHHILIDLNFSHIKATSILISFNIFSVIFAFSLQSFKAELILTANILFAIIFTYYYSHKRRLLLNKVLFFNKEPEIKNTKIS
jgi:UDP-GlcNAc:undecaprenyl-phosphate GlcNAc-1-phosphate transferase